MRRFPGCGFGMQSPDLKIHARYSSSDRTYTSRPCQRAGLQVVQRSAPAGRHLVLQSLSPVASMGDQGAPPPQWQWSRQRPALLSVSAGQPLPDPPQQAQPFYLPGTLPGRPHRPQQQSQYRPPAPAVPGTYSLYQHDSQYYHNAPNQAYTTEPAYSEDLLNPAYAEEPAYQNAELPFAATPSPQPAMAQLPVSLQQNRIATVLESISSLRKSSEGRSSSLPTFRQGIAGHCCTESGCCSLDRFQERILDA